MEDKKVLNNKELEKVSGGTNLSDMPQHDERQGWTSSKLPTENITVADGPDLYDYFLDIVE